MQEESSSKLVFRTLTKKRKEKGWSLAYVARHLYLTPSCVQYLERADFEGVPRGPYGAGYLKSYCELLGMDPEPLTEVYRNLNPEAPCKVFQQSMMSRKKLSPQYEHKKYKTFYGLACAVMLFVFSGLVTSQTLISDNASLLANTDTQIQRQQSPTEAIRATDIGGHGNAVVGNDEDSNHFQSL